MMKPSVFVVVVVAATIGVTLLLLLGRRGETNTRPGTFFRTSTAAATIDRRRVLKRIQGVGFSGNPPASLLPLGECEGDCDPGQCGEGLVCYEKDPNTAVPGCIGGENDRSKTDYCVRKELISGGSGGPSPTPAPPTPSPPTGGGFGGMKTLKRLGNDKKPSNVFPLGLCEGDCDSDRDCQPGLVCFKRGPFDKVDGCLGGQYDSSPYDYCVKPSQALTPNPTPAPMGGGGGSESDIFRLKLYWQKGYFWQEETRERLWCAQWKYDGLPGNGMCWYGTKRGKCHDNQLYIAKCTNDPHQKFRFVKLSNNEVQIKAGKPGVNLCFERVNKSIYLKTCNVGEENQRWYAPNGDFDGPRFEFSQRRFNSNCITQMHHPKAGEVLELLSCRAARSKSHETSFWNKF